MRRFLLFFCILLLCWSCAKFDDSELQDRMDHLEDRINQLEQLCQHINEDIVSLEAILSALQSQDYITGIDTITGNDGSITGYVIRFSKSTPITIHNGKNGLDGISPDISVRQDADGHYYWTLNGNWLTDKSGNKIRAEGSNGIDGITPQFKIADQYWYLSYDNGASWTQLGKATGADGKDATSIFNKVTENETSVSFTLSDGSVITVPKYKPLAITFHNTDDLVVLPNTTYDIKYSITGVTGEIAVKALAQDGFIATVHMETITSGTIEIITPSTISDSEILIFVSENHVPSLMHSINIIKGAMVIATQFYYCESAGTTIDVSLSTNFNDYTVEIPDKDRSWISLAETRSNMREETVQLQISPNNTAQYRTSMLGIRSKGRTVGTVQIFQQATASTTVPLRLLVNKARVTPSETVTFTVMLDHIDVTTQATIFNTLTGKIIEGNSYQITSEGTVSFAAEYMGMQSRNIEVSTADFQKNVLLFNFVSNRCPYSIQAINTINEFQQEHPNMTTVINVHHPTMGADPMIPENIDAFLPYFGNLSGVPTTYLDLFHYILGAISYSELESQILALSEEYASAGLALTTDIENNTIRTTVNITASMEGEYYLGLMLAEDYVMAPQTGCSYTLNYPHTNVFRKNLTPIPGQAIGCFRENEQQSFIYTADATGYNIKNCKIIGYIYIQEGDKYHAVNTAVCPAGEYRPYKFLQQN